MPRGTNARDELEATAAEYRHIQSEHRRAGVEGTVRRHLHARLSRLGSHFERLLEKSVANEGTREAWRRCLHEGLPAPAQPRPPERSLLFKGRARSSARSSKRLLRRVPTSPIPPGSQPGSMPPPSPPTGSSTAHSR
jgi:hypothetical protein